VASPQHPLALFQGRIPRQELTKHIQLVLTDRSDLTSGRDFAVASPATWRLADLSTKHAFLKDGVGWGGMPLHMIERDLSEGALSVLDVDDMPPLRLHADDVGVSPARAASRTGWQMVRRPGEGAVARCGHHQIGYVRWIEAVVTFCNDT